MHGVQISLLLAAAVALAAAAASLLLKPAYTRYELRAEPAWAAPATVTAAKNASTQET
jgi:hypothetical protein